MNDNLENKLKEEKSRRSFLKKTLSTIGSLVLASYIGITAACSNPVTPPPPPPTKYKHELKATVERTLHTGEPITVGTYDVTMRSNGKQYNNIALGTKVTLDETTSRIEKCNVIVRVPGCHPREHRNLDVTNNDLAVKDVFRLADLDLSYLLSDVLTHKVNGNSKNTSWVNRTMAASFNEYQGLRLDQAYIDSISQALTEFRNAGKRYVGKPLEETFIQTLTFNPNGTNPLDSSVPPNGEYWAFRRTDLSGVTNITYPTTFVNVSASKEFVNQSSAIPAAAYREAFDALIGDGQEIGELARFLPCVPLLMWRARDGNDYWINSDRESQEGIDPYSGTVFNAYAQVYTVLEKSSFNSSTTGPSTDFLDNPNIGPGGIDYSVEPGVPSLARGMPPRSGEGTQRTIRKDSRN